MLTTTGGDDDCDCDPKWLQLSLAMISACAAIIVEKAIDSFLEHRKEIKKQKQQKSSSSSGSDDDEEDLKEPNGNTKQ